jgi:hypothetical protein
MHGEPGGNNNRKYMESVLLCSVMKSSLGEEYPAVSESFLIGRLLTAPLFSGRSIYSS